MADCQCNCQFEKENCECKIEELNDVKNEELNDVKNEELNDVKNEELNDIDENNFDNEDDQQNEVQVDQNWFGHGIQNKDLVEEGEQYEFGADMQQLMNLIINTFYTNKDVFLRELISNASDALDKVRFSQLTDQQYQQSLQITLNLDEKNKTIEIQDSGIGMTKKQLIDNIGTIASSGTKRFIQQLQQNQQQNDFKLIGQFGVGFYSAFLVAEKVEVITKSKEEGQCYKWISNASGKYIIQKENTDHFNGQMSGTKIVLHIKNGNDEFLQKSKISEIVKKHSQYIQYPITLKYLKEVEKEVEIGEHVEEKKNEDVVIEEEKEKEKEKKKEKIKVQEEQNEKLNQDLPVWIRDDWENQQQQDDEYKKLYKQISNDYGEPSFYKNYKLEGSVSYRVVLFIPKQKPFDMFMQQEQKKKKAQLYVRRVLIDGECKDLVPDYLNFMVCLVDSDDLPLNISREFLQQNKIIKQIQKTIVKKSIEMFTELQSNQEKYDEFYKNFNKNIKLGIHDDSSNREKLQKLLRFNTTKSGDKKISLDNYVDGFQQGQSKIYYISGDNKKTLQESPLIQSLKDKQIEVILMDDPLDEYIMQTIKNHKGKTFVDCQREQQDDILEDKELQNKQEEFKQLIDFFKTNLSSYNVEKVKLGTRHKGQPLLVLCDQYGPNANLEKIMKCQALKQDDMFGQMERKKIVEINPENSIIQKLNQKVKEGNTQGLENMVKTIYETSQLNSGYQLQNPSQYTENLFQLLDKTL